MDGKVDFDALWDYYRPDETETKFRKLVPELESNHLNKNSYLQLLTQIARAQGLQGKFEEAHRTLDQVESSIKDEDALRKVRIRYLLERGRVLNSSGKIIEARPYFFDAWDLAREANEDFYAVDAAHMIAIVERLDNKLEWNLKALELAEKSADPKARKWAGSLFNNIGWTYFDQKRYEGALDAFEKALKHRIEDDGRPEEIRIAKWCVAKALRILNHTNEALRIQRELLDEYEKIGQKDGYVYEELGECLLAFGQNREARKYFALAYEELSKDQWLVSNDSKRLDRLKDLASNKQDAADFPYSSYS